MNWTTEKPTKPGWYWWRASSKDAPECVRFISEDCVLRATNDPAWTLEQMEGHFAGPIPEPVEADDPLKSLKSYGLPRRLFEE